MITPAEMRAEAHARTERGTRCFESGRCRLPNSYLYDKEIIPRVAKAITADGRFAGTSVWAEGQRRWVTLEGLRAHARRSGRAAAAGARPSTTSRRWSTRSSCGSARAASRPGGAGIIGRSLVGAGTESGAAFRPVPESP